MRRPAFLEIMSSARLMVAGSGHDADMLYATRFYADDPFVWWEARGKTHVALSPLEIDRAKPIARVTQVHFSLHRRRTSPPPA
jgi:Xaa-Pro aminopeptidase